MTVPVSDATWSDSGDVPATWADARLLQRLTGYCPETRFREGVARFVQWYREYYSI